jgi:hypothetical protein
MAENRPGRVVRLAWSRVGREWGWQRKVGRK